MSTRSLGMIRSAPLPSPSLSSPPPRTPIPAQPYITPLTHRNLPHIFSITTPVSPGDPELCTIPATFLPILPTTLITSHLVTVLTHLHNPLPSPDFTLPPSPPTSPLPPYTCPYFHHSFSPEEREWHRMSYTLHDRPLDEQRILTSSGIFDFHFQLHSHHLRLPAVLVVDGPLLPLTGPQEHHQCEVIFGGDLLETLPFLPVHLTPGGSLAPSSSIENLTQHLETSREMVRGKPAICIQAAGLSDAPKAGYAVFVEEGSVYNTFRHFSRAPLPGFAGSAPGPEAAPTHILADLCAVALAVKTGLGLVMLRHSAGVLVVEHCSQYVFSSLGDGSRAVQTKERPVGWLVREINRLVDRVKQVGVEVELHWHMPETLYRAREMAGLGCDAMVEHTAAMKSIKRNPSSMRPLTGESELSERLLQVQPVGGRWARQGLKVPERIDPAVVESHQLHLTAQGLFMTPVEDVELVMAHDPLDEIAASNAAIEELRKRGYASEGDLDEVPGEWFDDYEAPSLPLDLGAENVVEESDLDTAVEESDSETLWDDAAPAVVDIGGEEESGWDADCESDD